MELNRAIAPDINEFNTLEISECRVLTLDNGIKLNVIDHGEFDVNRLTMSWNGGANDVDSFSTLMLATELMREGSKSYSGAEFAETLDYNGAWLKSNFHSHHSSIVLHSLNSKFDNVIPSIVESITSPTFPSQEFEINREKLATRKDLNLTKVAYLSNLSNQKLIFGENHPCSKDETSSGIRNISINDVQNIHNSIFTANGCELFLAGRITPKIEDSINNNFGQLPLARNTFLQRVIPISPSAKNLDIIDVPHSMQSAITMSIPTIPRSHPDYIDLRYTVMALGGYFGSRLMTNIREEKGYTYGIGAGIVNCPGSGVLVVTTEADNQYIDSIIHEVYLEMDRMCNDLAPKEELEMVRNYMLGDMSRSYEGPFSLSDAWIYIETAELDDDFFVRSLDAIRSVTSEEIRTLAQRYFCKEKLIEVVAGKKV